MRLTRRDAVAALAAVGIGGAVGIAAEVSDRDRSGGAAIDDAAVTATMIAVAEVVYPSELAGVDGFVETFVDGRLTRVEHAAGLREAVEELNDRADRWFGGRVDELSLDDRDALLRSVGADTAAERRAGTTAERVRYYLVNDLLLALYSSPTGGELVGIENPQGHPGGLASYQRGPNPS